MTTMRTAPQSFVGGELSSRMFGRPDDPKYAQGAARLRNLLVEPSGTARRRPGSQFVRSTRNPNARARLIPFGLGGGQTVQVEIGLRQEYPGSSTVPAYVRLHTRGATVLYGLAWSAATAYVVGDQVLQGGQLYRCRLAHTNQTPPNATYWETLEWVQDRTVNAAAPAGPVSGIVTGSPGELFFGTGNLHGLEANETVELTGLSGTTAPAGLTYGTVYYAIIVDPERIRLAATPGGAALPITTVGGGTLVGHRVHRRYYDGEVTTRSGSAFYCRKTRPIDDGTGLSILPTSGNETYWYQMPATGELELPAGLAITEAQLFAATYSQQGLALTIAAKPALPFELRYVASYQWNWQQVEFAPGLSAPTGVVATATKRGTSIGISAFTNASPTLVTTLSEHNLVPGLDHVYVEDSGDGTLNDRYFGVGKGTSGFSCYLLDPDTGVPVGSTGSGAVGTLRRCTLYSATSTTYVVTAVGSDDRESPASAEASATNNLTATGAYNTITWAAVAGAVRYRIYKKATSGLFGEIGQATATTFDDRNLGPQLDRNPPLLDTSLDNQAPQAVTHHEGRRWFALEQDVWGTKSNTESDLGYSIPVKATDRIKQRLKSRLACAIRHLVPIGGRLLALADTTEFRIAPVDSEALTPDSFSAAPHSYIGAAAVQPAVAQNVVAFAGASGGHVFALGYQSDAGGLVAGDLCERASHLFDGLSIVQLAAQQAPVPTIWCVSSNGLLLGLTYVPSQAIWAWHWHDTDGAVESVSVGSEDGEDRVYIVVRRTVNGSTVRYVERLATLAPVAWADSWFVDAGLRYSGAPTATISGLAHLEGKTVAVFADGQVQTTKVVTGGQITLDAVASQVLVGLPCAWQLQTLPAMFAVEAYGSGRPKNVSQVWVRVDGSGQFNVGARLDDLMPASEITAGAPFTGLVQVRVPHEWTNDGQLFLEGSDPVPATIVSITAEMAVGG